ncbi:MAG: glycosyltransferase [Nanoarchaeota archaeon]|nr:glycosyltransferase [Nanoarchaeota archaeon]MBU1322370.1 glycosyltransferase [Nanoarchaeota archaeon]MBU1598397.1 glycosyltransferase [Nanoarchaeota archaeon]MBU2440774.1 glycosyltransferase [Nanoarchaeota archaeon]
MAGKTKSKDFEYAQKVHKTKKEKRKKVKEEKKQKISSEKEQPRNKRLLIATDNFLPRWDGISRFLSEMIPRLKHKFDITLLSPDFGASSFDKDKDIKIIKIPLGKFRMGDYTSAKFKYKTIRKEVKRADIVFTQTIGPVGLLALMASKRCRKKSVSFMHSIEWELVSKAAGIFLLKKYLHVIVKLIAKKVYKKASLLIVPSENIAEMLTWQGIKSRKKVIHLGVDTKKFLPAGSKINAKNNLGLNPDSFVIGFHGRIGREKDLPTLLRAFIQVKKIHPNTHLMVIGDGVEGIKKKLASVQGVILPGSTDNVVPYLQAMDVYCLPSLTETTSLTTLEAMACGVPVVATKVGFVKDYILNGFNGLFFQEKNSYDLTKKILYLMKKPELMRQISLEARKTVEKEFDWDKTAKEIEEALSEMV